MARSCGDMGAGGAISEVDMVEMLPVALCRRWARYRGCWRPMSREELRAG